MPKETLQELSFELKEIQDEIQLLSELEVDTEHLEQALETLKDKITKKVNAIDHIAIGFDVARDRLLIVAKLYENEARTAKLRAEAMEKNKERIYQHLADVGIVSRDKPLRTGHHTYYIGKVNGGVVIDDQSKLPDKYIKTKIEQVIDKAQLRNDIISGTEIEGVKVEQREKVMRR